MKTILSIDFDIFMGKDLALYNDLLRFSTFDELVKLHPMLNQVRFDLHSYIMFTNFLNTVDKKKIHFITNHQEMIPILKKNNVDRLINIDAHHDVCYGGDYDENNPTCANWVRYVKDHNYAKSYEWIGTKESAQPDRDFLCYIGSYKDIENFDVSSLPVNDIDQIIICLSPEWIPKKFLEYYERWQKQYGKESKSM